MTDIPIDTLRLLARAAVDHCPGDAARERAWQALDRLLAGEELDVAWISDLCRSERRERTVHAKTHGEQVS